MGGLYLKTKLRVYSILLYLINFFFTNFFTLHLKLRFINIIYLFSQKYNVPH